MQAYAAVLASAAPAAVEFALKGALWLCVVFMFAALLRAASASARHLVWCLGVAGLFALPLLSSRVPWRIAVPVAVAPMPPLCTAPMLPRWLSLQRSGEIR